MFSLDGNKVKKMNTTKYLKLRNNKYVNTTLFRGDRVFLSHTEHKLTTIKITILNYIIKLYLLIKLKLW
jgi:hypothetical protein